MRGESGAVAVSGRETAAAAGRWSVCGNAPDQPVLTLTKLLPFLALPYKANRSSPDGRLIPILAKSKAATLSSAQPHTP